MDHARPNRILKRLQELTLVYSVLLPMAAFPGAAAAQWLFDGAPLSTAANNQSSPVLVSDGDGGVIVTWQDQRSGFYDIYAQRIDASGAVQWTYNGVPLCIASNHQEYPAIVSDGAGGAIVAWTDLRNGSYDVYAQRISAAGAVLWTANGVPISTFAFDQFIPRIASDGAGGAIVAWYDYRSAVNTDIYAQRINAAGVVQWTANGVPISTAAGDQYNPVIASDGAAGAIIAWHDFRNGNSDIYAQRVSAAGTVQWTANGLAVVTAGELQWGQTIVPDGMGGAIVAWEDYRSVTSGDVYAQRINAAGAVQWTANGVVLSQAAYNQYLPTLASDGAGGGIVAWSDARNGTNYDIYAQRINAAGVVQWMPDGVPVSTVASDQDDPTIASDDGGAIVAWWDTRNGGYDIYAQRIDASGAPEWTVGGMPVSTSTGNTFNPTIAADGAGNAIVTWQDTRNGTYDVYAQRLEARFGEWGQPDPILEGASDNPNDQGGKVALNWRASDRDVPGQQFIYSYTIWRALDEATAQALVASSGATVVDGPVGKNGQAVDRVVWREHTPAANYYWELIGSQPAYYDEAYSFLASTRQDSLASSTATHYFRVAAQGWSQFYNYPSNVLSAHSVDNLAPPAPLMLTAQRVGPDVNLRWNHAVAPDLRDYSVYRGTAAGVTPVPIHFLSSSVDTVLVDANAPPSALYYIVTAQDVHANQSAPSNEASVGATTGIGDTPAITALTVLQNHPNPFTASTELEIGLPVNSDLSIEVFDVAGRRVSAQTLAQRGAGWQKVALDGRADDGRLLSSGVYFYRVTANGTTITKKMVIAR